MTVLHTALGTKRWLALGAALVLGATTAAQDTGGMPPVTAKPQAIASKTGRLPAAPTLSFVGKIVDIDKAQRNITIQGPRGRIAVLPVAPGVRNFDQIKVGDQLRVDYRIGIALALKKNGDGIREKVESEGGAVADRGAKPGGALIKRTTIVANVEHIDRGRHVVTLKGPEGNIVDMRVSDPALLKDVKVGNQVVANVTEALAIQVRKP